MRKPQSSQQGRRLAESLRQAAKIAEGHERDDVIANPGMLPGESDGFRDGVSAERHYRDNICPNTGVNPLGPYIPQPMGISLGGKEELVRFPSHLQIMFAQMNPEMSTFFISWLKESIIKQNVRKWWKRAYKVGIGVVVAAFATARWGIEQVPFLKQLADMLRGGGS